MNLISMKNSVFLSWMLVLAAVWMGFLFLVGCSHHRPEIIHGAPIVDEIQYPNRPPSKHEKLTVEMYRDQDNYKGLRCFLRSRK